MRKFFPAAAAASTLLLAASAASAGVVADMTTGVNTELTAMKTDLGALAPTILGFVMAVGAIFFVVKLIKGVSKG